MIVVSSVAVVLETVLRPGMEVVVDYGPNTTDEGPVFEECSHASIALLLYTGPRPNISDLRHKPFPLAEDENSKYLVAKIVKAQNIYHQLLLDILFVHHCKGLFH